MSRSEEIIEEIEQINRIAKKLADNGNELWLQKDRLRAEYEKLTGNQI